jgi:hypothetical protein
MTDTRTVLIGLCVLAVASAAVFWRGGRLERAVMTLAVFCWATASIGQLATGSPVIPIILADLVFAIGVLVMVLRYHRSWLYLIFAVEALRLLLHGAAFELDLGPNPAYRMTNNVLSTAGLVVLVAVSLWPKRAAQQEPQDAEEAQEA